MMNQPQSKTLTRNEADLALRYLVSEYQEAEGLNLNDDWFGPFRRRVSYLLNADFTNISALEDAVQALDELARVEDGVHDQLRENAAGTVSNRESLIEGFESEFNFAINTALESAQFGGNWINRYGERRILCAA